jgi:feruloyl-CoA synthase
VRVSYAEARARVDALSSFLLERGVSPERPLAILSDNSIASALLQLAAAQVGIPAAPISPAYSLMTRDLARVKHCLEVLTPGAVFADDGELFGPTLETVDAAVPRLFSRRSPRGSAAGRESFDVNALAKGATSAPVETAFATTGPDSIAKLLFTSGSTGLPKAVINTQRMLCTNQRQIQQLWPFLDELTPVLLDWLPWSHTFGGNHNFYLVLANGGSLFIDGGKPAPHLLPRTLANLREVSPNLYFNVPRGFGMLLPALEQDDALARAFFAELRLIFYAGAALPQDLWERLEALSLKHRGEQVPMVSAWGSTETAPMCTAVHFPIDRAGVIGLPAPGVEVKFVPNGGKQELRLKGPNVTPGYFRDEAQTAEAFDEEGFYKIGDAGVLADPADPSKGIVFDGRVAEDFKLSTGAWVNVGRLRVEAIAASDGVLADAVVCGHDTDGIGLLGIPAWPRIDALSGLGDDADPADKLNHPAVRATLHAALSDYNAGHGASSERVQRVLLLADPLSIDAGEITDKGYVNQRAVREQRPDEVERLLGGGAGCLAID